MFYNPYLFNYNNLFLTNDNCYGFIFRCSGQNDIKSAIKFFSELPGISSFQHHVFYSSNTTKWTIASIKTNIGDVFSKSNHPDKFIEIFKNIDMPIIGLNDLTDNILPDILKSQRGHFTDNSKGDGRLGIHFDHIKYNENGTIKLRDTPVTIKSIMTNPCNILDLSRIVKPADGAEAYYAFTCIKTEDGFKTFQTMMLYNNELSYPPIDFTEHPMEIFLAQYFLTVSLPLGASKFLEENNVMRAKFLDNLDVLSI
tara:strand:- start:62 stop:826 length:765 start_codon:yes stop_codon:yes gene_type:complete